VLLLLRHGEATANVHGLLLGRADVPLTEKGCAQAAALRSFVVRATALVSSPLERAVATAKALRLDVPIEVDARWVELDYGEHEGAAPGDLPAELWERWRSDPGYRPRGGESLADVGTRVRSACDELFAPRGPARLGEVVVVSHVSPIKAAVAWALGAPDSVAWRMHLSTGSLTSVGWGTEAPLLHAFNVVP
jgi:broad specificity phosphatase PhoE